LNTPAQIQNIAAWTNTSIHVDLLRLDLIHPVISGNKWYKLRYYIEEALQQNTPTIASFGGPYSNHIVALAYTAKMHGIKSIGYIRSNEGEPLTPSMSDALSYGMELIYLGRTFFQEKKEQILQKANSSKENDNAISNVYFINEGGYGQLGAKGASTILHGDLDQTLNDYDFIACAVGTGTMMAGIINGAKSTQKIIGIPVLKNEGSLLHEIEELLLPEKKIRTISENKNYTLFPNYHQGGYAKTTTEQINFMNQFWECTKTPTDIVYTGKLLFAIDDLIKNNYFPLNSKLLVIHSGGLQGNRSLNKGVLSFQ